MVTENLGLAPYGKRSHESYLGKTKMRAWSTLGDYVAGLDTAGKLVRIGIPINKDTELHPFVRLQFRGLPENQRRP